MQKLKIITSTTRPGHKGILVANWITEIARADQRFETELLDLAEIGLPLMDEPNHPRLRQYTQEHTKAWSKTIDSADCFIIVLGEYNFGFPAPIKNALDYLYHEWNRKPVGIASYGGVSAGLRATQMLKQVLTTLSMMPVTEAVSIPFFSKYINDEGLFEPEELAVKSAHAMLDALHQWSEALAGMRGKDQG